MAISAAGNFHYKIFFLFLTINIYEIIFLAFSYRMGPIDNKNFRFWQTELGFGLGNWIYTKPVGYEK